MNSQDVILGTLMDRSLTGYEIKQLFETLYSYFYSSSYGTIYPMLHRMEKDELLTKESILQDGKPNKNVYTITEKGKKQFNEYLQSPIEAENVKSDFLMRLFFGEYVGNSKVIEWLEKAQIQIMEQLDQLKDLRALYKDKMHPSQVICIQIGMKNYEAKLEMITEGLIRLRNVEHEERD
ncbi:MULTISPECIES: PadR family transcriptional regulator [Paenibacillus]|uniref:PadR family transcriptional regulator n=1 Tax=Paenibacillus violae TaxID=3077234 RepID=A0ABU3RJG2_9BACL|nr:MULTISPECIES: PadR family transcriptional regulator [Paenibacillus]MDU0204410.1 PadR family transcriptional regulator [Paenibacillus sp. PFR10]MEC0266746.1 PadR family transcriptional regulator [Paenibacillus anseongense]